MAGKNFVKFLLRFTIVFGVLYLGTLAVIGLANPGEYYSRFVDRYFDYVSGIKHSLIAGTRFTLGLFGIPTYTIPGFIVRITNGTGVTIAMDCVGYGVMSFWAAYVAASGGHFKRMAFWILAGFFILWLINVIRISLLLVAYNKHWGMPLGLDHHTWFNIAAYIAIFTMMYGYERSKGTGKVKVVSGS